MSKHRALQPGVRPNGPRFIMSQATFDLDGLIVGVGWIRNDTFLKLMPCNDFRFLHLGEIYGIKSRILVKAIGFGKSALEAITIDLADSFLIGADQEVFARIDNHIALFTSNFCLKESWFV